MIRYAVFATLLFLTSTQPLGAEQKTTPAAPTDRDGSLGGKLSEALGPYVQTTFYSIPNGETREAWKKKYERLAVDEKVAYCIDQLRNESWSEWDYVDPWKTYTSEPEGTPSRELVKLGRAAMPQLLRALDSRVPTKIYPSRHCRDPSLVQDAALEAIEDTACRSFRGDLVRRVRGLTDLREEDQQQIRKRAADWWERNKGSDEVQWAKEALLSETGSPAESRGKAIGSLYHRLGKKSYPMLAEAYHRLPKGREEADVFDETRYLKVQILQWLLKAPSKDQAPVFAKAVQDAPLWVRIDGAEGLWAVGDPSGLDIMVKETEGRLLKDFGSRELDSEYQNLVSFLVRCNTPRSRETVYKCLAGRNPYLRKEAIRAVPSLHLEKAVRALPGLFDDPFVLGGSYTETQGNVTRIVPPRRMCHEAAAVFAQVVPEAPRFAGSTSPEQQASIDQIKQWWKDNGPRLKWDDKRGVLVRSPSRP